MSKTKKIGLCCIVKNEEKVIARLIDSVSRLVDFAVIVDTGSTDDTKATAIKKLEELNIPYEFAHEQWKNFSHNRNLALDRLRAYEDIDYCFIIDADEIISLDSDFDPQSFKNSLKEDIYKIETLFADTLYYRQLIFKNDKGFYYRGVLHEFITCNEDYSTGVTNGLKVVVNTDGHRSKNKNKYAEDAIVLEKALQEESDPRMISRYTFYLAQSYRDSGDWLKALETYKKRLDLGFFEQEIFESMYNITKMLVKLDMPVDKVVETGLKAFEFDKSRIEPIHEIVRYCRLKGQYYLGYVISSIHLNFTQPKEALFKIHWIYDWGFLDETAVCAYYSGKEKKAIEMWEELLLKNNNIPEGDIKRIQENITFARNNT